MSKYFWVCPFSPTLFVVVFTCLYRFKGWYFFLGWPTFAFGSIKATASHTGKLLRAASGIQRETKNDERDLLGRFIKWGFSMPVTIEDIDHQTSEGAFTTHWVRPSSWVKELLRMFPQSLTGGFINSEDIGLQLSSFWKAYRLYHGEHSIFNSNLSCLLHRVIPLALFGDEGRGPKRGQVLIWSIESILGLEDLKHSVCNCGVAMSTLPAADVAMCSHEVAFPGTSAEFGRARKQTTNNKHHSYLTRHAVFILPHWVYKGHPEIEHTHIKLMVEDLQHLFSHGVEVNGTRWFAAVVASKGDFKHQMAIGNLDRSYTSIGTTYGNLMCSFCMAGAPGYPFESVEHEPLWARTLFCDRPWTDRPTLTTLEYDESKPEDLLKLDIFHLWKVGTGRDLVGSGVVVFCRLGLFDAPGDDKAFPSRLARAHSSFKLWTLANRKSPGLQSFSKAFFSMKSFADSPWSNSKGSDTTLLSHWLLWFTGLLLTNPTAESQPHERLLRIFKHTVDQALQMFSICYGHGLWLDRICAKHLYTRMILLLRGYRSLAAEAMKLQMVAWALKPKFHAMHHVAFGLRQQLLNGSRTIMNPISWGNEQNEDTVGRIARLSRKVSVRTITKRTLSRYFLKKRALMKRQFRKVTKT